MIEGKSEADLAADLSTLAEMLPPNAQFVMGAANSTSKKLKQVVKAKLDKPVTLKNPVGTYTFNQPIFVRQVQVFGPDIAAARAALSFTVIGVDGKRVSHKLNEGGKGTTNPLAFFAANQVAAAVEISFSGKAPIAVTRIGFTGYRFDEIEELSGRLRQGLDLRRDLESYGKTQTATFNQAQQKMAALQADIKAAEGTKSELDALIATAEEEKSQGEAQLVIVRSAQADEQKTLTGLEAKVTAARNNEEQLKTEVKSLNEDIGKLKRELKQLENDRSVISDEYGDYVREGRGQATLYASIAGVCLVASLVGAGLLVAGAAHYLDPRVTSTSEAYALFIQRLPFTAAFAATIGLLLKLADYLIKGVYSIHQSRLTLARLLVIAKDTVYSSASDLDVSDADRLKERVRLKVDLLRQYLSAELGAKTTTTDKPTTVEPAEIEDDEETPVARSGIRPR